MTQTNQIKTEGNQNCLEGLRCPSCGSHGPLWIACFTVALVFDDGTDKYGDIEWEETSGCRCHSCEFSGTVRDFKVPAEE